MTYTNCINVQYENHNRPARASGGINKDGVATWRRANYARARSVLTLALLFGRVTRASPFRGALDFGSNLEEMRHLKM